MNKELYTTLDETQKELDMSSLDKESKRFLEKALLKRKLNGILIINLILEKFQLQFIFLF